MKLLLEPAFDRAGMAELENFELHIGRLLALIRLNARPFGLQPLVKRLLSKIQPFTTKRTAMVSLRYSSTDHQRLSSCTGYGIDCVWENSVRARASSAIVGRNLHRSIGHRLLNESSWHSTRALRTRKVFSTRHCACIYQFHESPMQLSKTSCY